MEDSRKALLCWWSITCNHLSGFFRSEQALQAISGCRHYDCIGGAKERGIFL